MKPTKLLVLLFTFLALFTGVLTGCSDNEQTNGRQSNKSTVTFLNSFYQKSWNFGASAKALHKVYNTLSREEEFKELIVTEVTVDGEATPRGYAITEKASGDLLYFVDVDRTLYRLVAVNVKADDTKTFTNINELDRYFATNEFDFIQVILDSRDDPNQVAAKLWGHAWSQGPCNQTTGLAQLYDDYYVLGIRVKHRPAVGVDGGEVWEPCGMH
ncbi:MAG: hypothetical protein EOO51_00055 [Flavobacterium sp.]|nr:MAG: hypothetical protein EOO51_00055 [Flavobacterium sp.]